MQAWFGYCDPAVGAVVVDDDADADDANRGLKIKKLLGEMVVESGFLVQNWVETCVFVHVQIFFGFVRGNLNFSKGFPYIFSCTWISQSAECLLDLLGFGGAVAERPK